jgi:hypothetical protein
MTAKSIASVGLLAGVKGIAAVGYLDSTGKLPMGGWPVFTTPHLRRRPPAKEIAPRKAIPLTVEAIFHPAKQPYIPVVENALATPPRKPEGYSEGVGPLLAQLAAGYPVSGSPGELAAIREALRRNQELLDRLEAERLAGAKRQQTMAALLFLMMEM